MNKKLFIVIFLFFITGCSLINTELTKVEPPTLTKTIMNGKWNISKVIFKDETPDNNFNYKDLIGKNVYFTVNGMVLGDNNYISSPNYKAKKVIASKFIYDKYNISKRKLGIEGDFIYAIDIYKKDDLFYEILKIDDETAYIYENGVFLQVSKLSDNIDEEEYNSLIETIDFNKSNLKKDNQLTDQSENAFLLGIKFKDENDNYRYSTIFMSFLDRKVKDYKYLENIIVPRQNGFYLLTTNRFELDEEVGDKFQFKSLDKEEEVYEIGSDSPSKKEIRFVSGDYINYLEGEDKLIFKLYYLSSLEDRNKLSLSDLIINGKEVFEESTTELKKKSMANIDESNIGLIRDKGYWKLVGRVNYLKKVEKDQEFNLNIPLPKSFVKYDNLKIPFANIKEKLPWINDAFISPNGRFLITMENEYIKVYNIDGNKIETTPILEEKIPEKSTTIMIQWAIGRFVANWEEKIK